MKFDESALRLEFNEGKQEALIGHILDDERFFLQARLILKPHWFHHPNLQRLFKAKCEFFEKYKRSATNEELLDSQVFRQEDQAVQNKVRALVGICRARAVNEWHLDKLQEELTNWLRSVKLQQACYEAEQEFNRQRDDSVAKACEIIKGFGRTVDQIQFQVTSGAADFSDLGMFGAVQEERQGGLTFGLKLMDRLLTPHGDGGGGLFPGDTTLLLAGTNIGKSATLITIATANIMKGKDVLILTHEGQKS